jgi:SAM-dependent MidA family methyltransferase
MPFLKKLLGLMESFDRVTNVLLPRTSPPQLLREWIEMSLYNPEFGYFEKETNVITRISKEIDFGTLKNQEEYDLLIASFYDDTATGTNKGSGAWHTPSEIFKPYFGEALVKAIKNDKVYELGPGNASLCSSIIDKHRQIKYTLLEKSKRFHEYQKRKFQHEPRLECINFTEDLRLKPIDSPVTIILCEVLDNLVHDLIRVEPDGSISEGYIVTNGNARYNDIPGKFYFEFKPLKDPLILSTLNFIKEQKNLTASSVEVLLRKAFKLHTFIPEYIYPGSCFFLPTGCYKLLARLKTLFPKADFVISDFDKLTDTIPRFNNAPVVQTVYKGDTVNCTTILVKPGLCDIFFQTDFTLLSKMIKYFWPDTDNINVIKQEKYLRMNADMSKTRTQNGFNPLVDTFKNVSLLISQH